MCHNFLLWLFFGGGSQTVFTLCQPVVAGTPQCGSDLNRSSSVTFLFTFLHILIGEPPGSGLCWASAGLAVNSAQWPADERRTMPILIPEEFLFLWSSWTKNVMLKRPEAHQESQRDKFSCTVLICCKETERQRCEKLAAQWLWKGHGSLLRTQQPGIGDKGQIFTTKGEPVISLDGYICNERLFWFDVFCLQEVDNQMKGEVAKISFPYSGWTETPHQCLIKWFELWTMQMLQWNPRIKTWCWKWA